MKKYIFIVLILVISLNVKPIKAIEDNTFKSILVVEKGMGSFSMLFQNGYNIVTQDVKWNTEGIYDVVYQNSKNLGYYKRKVIITSKTSLEKGIVINNDEIKEEMNGKEFLFLDILYEDDYSFYIYGGIKKEEDIIQMDFPQCYAYLAYYKNGVFKWEYENTNYSYISKIAISPTNIVAMITDYEEELSLLKLLEFNQYGDKVREKILDYNNESENAYILYNKGFLYIVHSTNITSKINIVLLKINYSDFEKHSEKIIGEDGVNKIVKVRIINDKLHLLARIQNKTKTINEVTLFIYDDNLIEIDKVINNPAKNEKEIDFYFYRNRLYFICLTNFAGIRNLKIYEYRKNTKYDYVSDIIWKSENDVYIDDAFIDTSDGYLQIFINGYSYSESRGFLYARITVEDMKIIDELYFEKIYPSILSLEKTNDDNIHLLSIDNNELIINSINSVKIEKNKNTNVYNVIINGYSYYSFFPHKDLFGLYKEIVNYNSKKIEVCFEEEFYIFLNTNLTNDDIYDINTPIYSNGVMYINNEIINNGTYLKEEGKYSVRIVGYNHEEKVINFEIKSLCIKNKEEIDSNLSISLGNIKIENNQEVMPIKVYKEMLNYNEVIEDNNIFYKIMIISFMQLFSILITIFFRNKYVKKGRFRK